MIWFYGIQQFRAGPALAMPVYGELNAAVNGVRHAAAKPS